MTGLAVLDSAASGNMTGSARVDLKRLLPGLALGAAMLALLWVSADMARVARLLERAAWPPLALALAAYAADFVLRAWRFWLLLYPQRTGRAALGPTIAPFIASFGISDILPFRLGDVFRVQWFHSRHSLAIGRVIGAMIVERVLDMTAILVVAGVAIWGAQTDPGGAIVHDAGLICAGAVLANGLLLLAPAMIAKIGQRLTERLPWPLVGRLATGAGTVATSLRAIGGPRRIAAMLTLSMLLWLLEGVVMLGAWASLGGSAADWLKPLAAFAVSTLGTLVPALPGHFGSYEVAGVMTFKALGVGTEQAAATILLAHLLLWLPTALFAVTWLMAGRARRTRKAEPVPA